MPKAKESEMEDERPKLITDRLPAYNVRVLAFLRGYQVHSDVRWLREGFAFMVRHDVDSDSNGWSDGFLRSAEKDLGADFLEVVGWHHIAEWPSTEESAALCLKQRRE